MKRVMSTLLFMLTVLPTTQCLQESCLKTLQANHQELEQCLKAVQILLNKERAHESQESNESSDEASAAYRLLKNYLKEGKCYQAASFKNIYQSNHAHLMHEQDLFCGDSQQLPS